MSSCSTPKRAFETPSSGYQSEVDGSQSKRTRVGDSFPSSSGTESGSGTPSSSFQVQSVQSAIERETAGAGHPIALPHPHDTIRSFATDLSHQSFLPQNPWQLPTRPYPRDDDQDTEDVQDLPMLDAPAHVCFGMLRSIQIRIDPIQDSQSLSFSERVGENGVSFVSLDLSIQDDRCDILTQDRHIATMNSRTHHALSSLRLAKAPTWTGVISKPELENRIASVAEASSNRASSKVTCTMSILVAGPPSIAQALAKELARYHLFLQHPEPKPDDIEYDNPQYLSLVGPPCLDRPLLPPILEATNRRYISASDGVDKVTGANPGTGLDNASRGELRQEVEIEGRIQTKLESHQRQAVSFILSRESTVSRVKNKLWRPEPMMLDQLIYKHIITDAKSTEPADIRGGILADDMGVGKTLSMIASIVQSLPRGEQEVDQCATNLSTSTSSLIPATTTLVIVPNASLIRTWIDEIKKHVSPGALTYYTYHGDTRSISVASPPPYHVILSTYATVESDYSRSNGTGVLNCFHWHRVILDEAHVVRNSSTKQFTAVQSLSASIRWCMTGTPIQNSLDDLGSLVRFLRVPQLDTPVGFRKHIAKSSARGIRQPDYTNRDLLLDAICLRRKMSIVFPWLDEKPIEHRLVFSDAERKVYDELQRACNRHLQAAVNLASGTRESTLILTAKLRLRMFCNTGLHSLFLGSGDNGGDALLSADEILSMLQESGQNVCSVCKMEIHSLNGNFQAPVGNGFKFVRGLKCDSCSHSISNSDNTAKSLCEGSIRSDDEMEDIQPTGLQADTPCATSHVEAYPTKLEELLKDVKAHYSEDKSIIFTFWVQTLDLVGRMFHSKSIAFCRVDGAMNDVQRREALEAFQQNTKIRVLLMTIGTGALGLNNLSVASRIHILEPQWNPSVEKQAIGRALRWGQNKKVFVIRYIMQRTIEETIEKRQDRKKELSLGGHKMR